MFSVFGLESDMNRSFAPSATWRIIAGDVVYVPRQTWHLASNGGREGERSCRLAMNGFPYQAHMFETD